VQDLAFKLQTHRPYLEPQNPRFWTMYLIVTNNFGTSKRKCKGPHHDFDDFTTYDFTTFTTLRLVIDLETRFTVQKSSFYIDYKSWSRESREVVSREVVEVVMWSFALCHTVLCYGTVVLTALSALYCNTLSLWCILNNELCPKAVNALPCILSTLNHWHPNTRNSKPWTQSVDPILFSLDPTPHILHLKL